MEQIDQPVSRREWLTAAAYACVLLWVNAYVCRELFFSPVAHMNSMHGFWVALATRAGDSWFHSNWWPYWDCGIPFEFTYAPLVPAMTAAWSAVRGVPHLIAFGSVTGLCYCAGPLTLFLMAWLLTRAPGCSFAAALFYSLASPTQIIVPDGTFAARNFRDARRLFLMSNWDDTPHLAALALLPLIILFLTLSIRKRRPIYYAATALLIALAALASFFGPVMVAMAAICLLVVLRRQGYKSTTLLTIGIGALGYAAAAPFLSPSSLEAVRTASANSIEGWTMGSVAALAIVATGWLVLWRYLPRWSSDWRVQFFALFAYLTSSVPILDAYLHLHFLPQPGRYKFEMEFALAPLVVFGLRGWFAKASPALRGVLILLLVALAGKEVVSHRQIAKNFFRTDDVARSIEYRASIWAERSLPGVRVMMPGSVAQWANAFTGITQYSGSSWSMAANPVQQCGLAAIRDGGETAERDARVSLAWLKAFGVGAIGVSGPRSQEYWKPFAHPTKFEGILPVLWREDDFTIYRVPQRTASLAHVVPASAVLQRAPAGPGDIADLERYVAALDDPSLPPASFEWEGRNRIHIRTAASRGQAISIQVSYHPGWHAKAGGRDRALKRDGLGLMWIEPECAGPCEVQLDYDGGWELRLCRYISFGAILGLVALPLAGRWRKKAVTS